MKTIQFGWYFLRGAQTQKIFLILPLIGFCVSTAFLLSMLGVAQAILQKTSGIDYMYPLLVSIALAILSMPILSLNASSARLFLRKRGEGFSRLRLLGVSQSEAKAMAIFESLFQACSGAILGVFGYLLLTPVLGMLHFRGGMLGSEEVALSVWVIAGTALGMAFFALVSGMRGFEGLSSDPLDALNGKGFREPKVLFGLGMVTVVVFAGWLFVAALNGFSLKMLTFGFGFGVFFVFVGVLYLVGPWALTFLAKRKVRNTESMIDLIGARTVLENPRLAWRQISTVPLICLISVIVGSGSGIMRAVARSSGSEEETMLATDIQTGIIVTIFASLLILTFSIGVNQAAEIIEKRELLQGWRNLGVPIELINAIRVKKVMFPMVASAISGTVLGIILVAPLVGASLLLSLNSVIAIAGALVAGIGLTRFGFFTTKQLLFQVLEEQAIAAR